VIGVNTLSRAQKAKLRFTVEVRQVRDISRVLAHIMEVRGVHEARRV
jgi:GTP pyrophosphokinase